MELTPDLRAYLLAPALWRPGLDSFARATHLAVALVDGEGHLLGECINPRPAWGFLYAGRPTPAGTCPFSSAAPLPCTCYAAALMRGATTLASDGAGLVHFAVPLMLQGQSLGALLAGQVFTRYPEQLAVERAAARLGRRPGDAWDLARLEQPLRQATLEVYADLLTTFGDTFLHNRFHRYKEAGRTEELERLVTERTASLEEAQRQALQAERLAAIGQMVSGLAHESRNAMQRASACLEMLRLLLLDQPEALGLLERAENAQDDLHRLYEGVRTYAAPVRIERQDCDLAQVWREAWADLALARTGRAGGFREQTADVDCRCQADFFQLKQVFRNLLENALTASDRPVHIVIGCSETEIDGRPAIQVAVRDDGPGFARDQRGKLFEPFHTTKVRGTGLGLAICKRLVEAHDGRIEAGADLAPGAEVLITLPRRGR